MEISSGFILMPLSLLHCISAKSNKLSLRILINLIIFSIKNTLKKFGKNDILGGGVN